MNSVSYFAFAAALALVAGWRWWRAAARSIQLDPRQLAWCARAYWVVAATVLASGIACLATADYNGTPLQRTIVLNICLAVVPQAALFGFVLVPIGFRRERYRAWTFAKKLIVAECITVIPTAVGVAVHLFAFFRLESLSQ